MSEEDLLKLKKFCEESCNIVYDDLDSYDEVFSIADGIITDAACGIICAALPILKPICAAYRSSNDINFNKDLTNVLYSVYENSDIVAFFDMMRERKDPMLELRKKASKEYIKILMERMAGELKNLLKRNILKKKGNLDENNYFGSRPGNQIETFNG